VTPEAEGLRETNRARAGGALKREHAGSADLFETAKQVPDALGRDRSFEHRLRNHDSWKWFSVSELSRRLRLGMAPAGVQKFQTIQGKMPRSSYEVARLSSARAYAATRGLTFFSAAWNIVR